MAATRRVIAGAIAAGVFLGGSETAAQTALALDEMQAPLFLDLSPGELADAPSTRRARSVVLAAAQLARARDGVAAGASVSVTLNLFADAVFTAVLERIGPTDQGYVLTGRLADDPLSSVVLVVDGDIIAGSVRAPGVPATYAIRTAEDGTLTIREVDPAARPSGNDVAQPPPAAPEQLSRVDAIRAPAPPVAPAAAPIVGGDNGSTVDLLVLVTEAARDVAGGWGEVAALINLMVAETNQAFRDSGVVQRVRLPALWQVEYVEAWGRLGDDLDRLRDPNDGYLDWVHDNRDLYAADIVVLVVRYAGGDAVGQAYIADDEELAFGVVAVGDWGYKRGADGATFAHELGHIMGLHHDRYEETVCTNCEAGSRIANLRDYPSPYAFGYVNQRGLTQGAPSWSRWRTVMAYNTQCGRWKPCAELLRFSNPNQTYWGDPMGVPGSRPSSSVYGPSDARRRLNERRHDVANFRVASCLRGRALVQLRTDGGRFVRADNNGGGAVSLPWSGGSTTYTLVDRNGGCVEGGDAVSFRTSDGFYLRAALGGTRGVDARGTNAGPWERFVIRGKRDNQIRSGDDITLQALTGHYVSPNHGGLRADEPTAGARETLRIALSGR